MSSSDDKMELPSRRHLGDLFWHQKEAKRLNMSELDLLKHIQTLSAAEWMHEEERAEQLVRERGLNESEAQELKRRFKARIRQVWGEQAIVD